MKTGSLVFIIVVLSAVSSADAFAQKTGGANRHPYQVEIASPDGSIHVHVNIDHKISYSVDLDRKPLVVPSQLGLSFDDTLVLGRNVEVVDAHKSEHNSSWKNDFGKFSIVKDQYRDLRLRLQEVRPSPASSVTFELIVRVYDQGVALRYVLPGQQSLRKFKLIGDSTQFLFAENYRAWVGANTKYENPFLETRLNQLSGMLRSLPLVVETKSGYVAVAEADVRDWAGASLEGLHLPGVYGAQCSLISPVEAETPRESPWHALMIARNAGDLTVSTLLINLATSSQVSDTSWIHPGITAWDPWWTGVNPYWSQYKGLAARGNTQSDKDYIDLAAEMGWSYMLIHWYWYDQDSKDPETAIKPLSHINIPELMIYSKSKGVQLLLWVNSKNIRSVGAEKLFATYAEWGVSGVKIDFFDQNGSQPTLHWQEELLATAAKHKLLVDFHGTYTPTGLSRTWPNLITQEGVLGEEYVKLGKAFTPSHMIALPFTRGLLGPADTTPGGFINVREDRFIPNAIPAQVVGTRIRQLALSVLMDSPLLCLADSPGNYREQPGIEFYRGLPTTWDETWVLSAEMMQSLVQARRKGNGWWIAAMNNKQPLKLSIKLSFLGPGRYVLRGFEDTPESNLQPVTISEWSRTVTSNDTFTISMENAGGFAAIIKPESEK